MILLFFSSVVSSRRGTVGAVATLRDSADGAVSLIGTVGAEVIP